MKKRIISFILVTLMLVNISFANEATKVSDFNTENLDIFRQLIQELFYKDVTDKELYEAALKGMFQSLDPYSNYYNKEESTEFDISVSGKYSGIGIKFEGYSSYMRIVKVFAGTPAYKVGLKAGDFIIAIEGEDVSGWTTDKAASLIRGEAGTSVKLTILRGNETIDVNVDRANIQAESCSFDIINNDIAYIKIEEFNASTSEEIAQYLHAINITGYNKLILDLRDNPGGYVDQAVKVARNFVPSGVITTLKYKDSDKNTEYRSFLKANPYKMVVLVNEYSASSSEILAGSLQDNGIKLIGKKTYGKGVFQNAYSLKDGGSIKITTGQYFTPSGKCIDQIGLTPDFIVEGNEAQLQKAIEEVNKL